MSLDFWTCVVCSFYQMVFSYNLLPSLINVSQDFMGVLDFINDIGIFQARERMNGKKVIEIGAML